MQPELKSHPIGKKPLWITGIVLCVILVAAGAGSLVSRGQLAGLAKNNLFSLVGSLSGTTNQMLANTKALSNQVEQVQSKLGQLNQQNQILTEQTQTSNDLSAQLQTQISLTNNGISLMHQILQQEQDTKIVTNQLAGNSNQLAGQIRENSPVLQKLVGSLQVSAQESNTLYGQLDQLLAQLSDSEQEFRLFGQLNQLLPGLSNALGSLSSLGNTLHSQSGNSSQPLSGLTNGLNHAGAVATHSTQTVTHSTPSSQTNQSGGLLGSITSGLSNLFG